MTRAVIWGALTLAGAGLMVASLVPDRTPYLIYNPSDSAPIGWYRLEPGRDFRVGDQVASYLPDAVAAFADERGYVPSDIPVIKTVWALGGDMYCIADSELTVAGRPALRILSLDSHKRALPVLIGGCRRVADGHVLLASDHSAGSFDGRYFGPVPAELVLGPVTYLGAAAETETGPVGEMGWARGLGAEGKIKGSRAARGLTPCLHIIFYRAKYWHRETGFGLSSVNTWRKRGAVTQAFTDLHAKRRP